MKKNSKNGFTLIELLLAISIFMVIMLASSSIYVQEIKNLGVINRAVDLRSNLRIAMDFTSSIIREGTNISIGASSVTIDGNSIYLKNNILRYNYDPQQVVNNVTFFKVERVNEATLYKLTIGCYEVTQSVLIKMRR